MTRLVKTKQLTDGGRLRLGVFAGGCFWCMEPPFLQLEGVKQTLSGYTGGELENPTYEQVCGGNTGHVEAMLVVYDPHKVNYQTLLDIFWRNIDPTQQDGQFADRGSQYQSAIFYLDEQQREQAEESKKALAASGKFHQPIVTQILPFAPFYAAEDHHQQYFRKNPMHYRMYAAGSGRKSFIQSTWGKSD